MLAKPFSFFLWRIRWRLQYKLDFEYDGLPFFNYVPKDVFVRCLCIRHCIMVMSQFVARVSISEFAGRVTCCNVSTFWPSHSMLVNGHVPVCHPSVQLRVCCPSDLLQCVDILTIPQHFLPACFTHQLSVHLWFCRTSDLLQYVDVLTTPKDSTDWPYPNVSTELHLLMHRPSVENLSLSYEWPAAMCRRSDHPTIFHRLNRSQFVYWVPLSQLIDRVSILSVSTE